MSEPTSPTNYLDVAVALVPVLASLVGVWLGSWLQRADKDKDREEERKSLLRRKAEEIYTEISEVLRLNHEAVKYHINNLHNLPTEGLHTSYMNLGKIRALVNMYFPDANPIFDKFDISAAPVMARTQIDISKPTPEETLHALKERNLETCQIINRITADTLGEIRRFMNNEVKSLI